MAQHDYEILNQTFPNTRLDLNNSLSAIVSNNSGATEPSTTYAYQWWYDETTDTLKMRNSDNDAWITMFTFNQTADTYSLATDVELTITENLDLTGSATISGDLTVDTDTLYVDTTNNRVGVKNASPTVELDVTGEAKISGDLTVDTDTLYVDSSNNRVGIKNSSPSHTLDISDTSTTAKTLRVGQSSGISIADATMIISNGGSGDGMLRFDYEGTNTDRARIGITGSGQYLQFFTAGNNERMRIDNSGNLLVGTTTTATASDQGWYIGPNVNNIYKRTGTITHDFLEFYRGTDGSMSRVGFIRTDGTSTSYSTSSDYRLKENVVDITGATDRLKQLSPKRFNFIADADTTVDGFLAHEVQDIVPEAISGEKDETETKEKVVVNANGQVIAQNIEQTDWENGKIADEDGNTKYPIDSTWEATKVVPVYQGIDQSKLVPLLVKTIQELEARITVLENA